MINLAVDTEKHALDRWLSEPQLMDYLGYSKSTIRRFRQGGLPHVGTNRLRRYHLATVLQYLSEHA